MLPMADDDEKSDLVGEVFSSIRETLDSDPSADSESPRDVWWLRWLKYLSIIAVPAIVLGVGFLFADYMEQYSADSGYKRDRAERRVEQDTTGSMKFRFWMGAGVGGGLGMIYVVRCIIRKVDP
jgi:hypothetical protein